MEDAKPRRCEHCGATEQKMPRGGLLVSVTVHSNDCPAILKRRDAEWIVRRLAGAHHIRGESPDGCPFCGISMSDERGQRPRADIEQHDPDCLYRLAREWAADRIQPQLATDGLRDQLRRRGLWIDSKGRVVELCAYHDTDPKHDHVGIERCDPRCAWHTFDVEDSYPSVKPAPQG